MLTSCRSAAVTCAVVAWPGAAYRPLALMDPTVVVQVTAGCVAMFRLNWSRARATNCCEAPARTLAVPGVTTTLVSVWLT